MRGKRISALFFFFNLLIRKAFSMLVMGDSNSWRKKKTLGITKKLHKNHVTKCIVFFFLSKKGKKLVITYHLFNA